MYNIQKAVSRLDYAPKLKEIRVTDIKKGLGAFTPKPDKPVSFAALKETLKKAGYTLDTADITLVGTLAREGKDWVLIVDETKQRFSLVGESIAKVMNDAAPGMRVEITGAWRTEGAGAASREIINAQTVKKAESSSTSASFITSDTLPVMDGEAAHARFLSHPAGSSSGALASMTRPLAPIRTTTPGLTVYRGGAITPRLYLIKQHLGNLDVSRQVLDVSISYTPGPRLQLEVEAPLSRTAFDNGITSGSGVGLGNVTLWGKYRFYRQVKTYGDRQAAARFSLELPTGKKDVPSVTQINAPAFVRQQLTPINGGLSPHFDLAFSQAGGRFIFGGNAEAILRTERDGYRLGHELRINTDLEYVLLPRNYQVPGHELFAILETNFVQRGRGRLNGAVVDGSKATEYYLAPGLQYAAHPRFVIEGSVQLPVIRNTGPLMLRTDVNVLLGVKYLF